MGRVLTYNSLKLNPTKTESIFLHLPLRSSTLIELPPILLNITTIAYSKHFRNLSLHIDSTLSLDTHIAHMHKSIHLHCFRLIRCSIPFPIAVTIASSYILPLFDYFNNLYSIPPPTNLLNGSATKCCNKLVPSTFPSFL